MVRYITVLGTDTKPKFQQKKSKVKVMYFSDGALPQPVIRVSAARVQLFEAYTRTNVSYANATYGCEIGLVI